MESKIINTVKRNRLLYFCYYYFMTAFVNVIKLFIKTDDSLILFVVYGGKFYSDSPKCIYELMSKDSRFKNYKLVWAFRNPEKYKEIKNKVKIDTLSYFITAIRARCWITNEGVTRALSFSGKNTFYFFTTHTSLPKVTGKDAAEGPLFFKSKGCNHYDCTCAQSDLEAQMHVSMYGVKPDDALVIGYPKNDHIALHSKKEENAIKRSLGIDCNKKVVLYAPTFREEVVLNGKQNAPVVNLDKWLDILGDDYVILYRAHHSMLRSTYFTNSSRILDVSDYPDNSELLIASDILISDYSGIFFEFGVQEKPMFCYAYDYDEYVKHRKLYFDIRDEIPGGHMNEEDLINYIKNGDCNSIMKKIECFKEKYVAVYGHATEKAVSEIYKRIGK